ncbi:MAG: 5'-methylthioadenosine/adenosylhomocysteine nucleosidase [Clostridia bacterium]|nr:5'-methylthioadenosine/adenosylhomocysteine nucleosidase [Clostridia bacterium]
MIGIIGAMDIEVNSFKELMTDKKAETISGTEFVCGKLWGKSTVVAVSGVGKVNAAICTQTMCLKYNPDFVINSGVAGGLEKTLNICDVVVADAVIQHDMDTSPLGDPVGFISGIDIVEIPTDKNISEKLFDASSENGIHTLTGKIVSGDQFINSAEKKKYLVDTFGAFACEMEAAAIGHVAYKNNIPFCILRSISDNADGSSHISYNEFVDAAAKNLVKVVKTFFEKI